MTFSEQDHERDVLEPVERLGSLVCDHYHHFYHYQSSAQYLWLAEALRMVKKEEEARVAYSKALFQDHYNIEALKRKEVCTATSQFSYNLQYNKHPQLDAEFCASIGQNNGIATALHDEAVVQQDLDKAAAFLEQAIAKDPTHSNSFFARGKIAYQRGDYARAVEDLHEAIRLSHAAHDGYHRLASQEHFLRGREFWMRGEIDLAIADYSKALDLWQANSDARMARAQAYRVKGSDAMAAEDEKYII